MTVQCAAENRSMRSDVRANFRLVQLTQLLSSGKRARRPLPLRVEQLKLQQTARYILALL